MKIEVLQVGRDMARVTLRPETQAEGHQLEQVALDIKECGAVSDYEFIHQWSPVSLSFTIAKNE